MSGDKLRLGKKGAALCWLIPAHHGPGIWGSAPAPHPRWATSCFQVLPGPAPREDCAWLQAWLPAPQHSHSS